VTIINASDYHKCKSFAHGSLFLVVPGGVPGCSQLCSRSDVINYSSLMVVFVSFCK